MQYLTDFADLAVALPLALCVAAWLALSGWRRGAAVWLVALVGMLGGMLLLKLAVLGCRPVDSDLSSPSGHTAVATFLYGGMAAIVYAGSRGPGRTAPLAVVAAMGAVAAALFGTSRVALRVHTIADVVVGGSAGLAALLFFTWMAGPAPRGRLWWLLGGCLVLALALHGERLTVEPHLHALARLLSRTVCPA